jgi:hypothetical protein
LPLARRAKKHVDNDLIWYSIAFSFLVPNIVYCVNTLTKSIFCWDVQSTNC